MAVFLIVMIDRNTILVNMGFCIFFMLHSSYIHPKELQHKRLLAGLTQKQVAKHLQVHRVSVARWEQRYDHPVRREYIQALNELLKSPLTESLQPFAVDSPLPDEQQQMGEWQQSVEDALPDADTRDTLIALLCELAESKEIEAADLGEFEGAMLIWLTLQKLKLSIRRRPEKRAPQERNQQHG